MIQCEYKVREGSDKTMRSKRLNISFNDHIYNKLMKKAEELNISAAELVRISVREKIVKEGERTDGK